MKYEISKHLVMVPKKLLILHEEYLQSVANGELFPSVDLVSMFF